MKNYLRCCGLVTLTVIIGCSQGEQNAKDLPVSTDMRVSRGKIYHPKTTESDTPSYFINDRGDTIITGFPFKHEPHVAEALKAPPAFKIAKPKHIPSDLDWVRLEEPRLMDLSFVYTEKNSPSQDTMQPTYISENLNLIDVIKVEPNFLDYNSPYRARQYDMTGGENVIFKTPTQDSSGILWFEQDDLYALDGSELFVYALDSGARIKPEEFYFDADHNMWSVSTWGYKLSFYNGRKWYTTIDGGYKILFKDRNNSIWVSKDNVIYKIYKDRLVPMINAPIVEQGIKAAGHETNGIYWFITNNGYFIKFDVSRNEQLSIFYLSGGLKVNTIAHGADQDLWVCADRGLFNLKEERLIQHLPADRIGSEVFETLTDSSSNQWVWLASGEIILIRQGRYVQLERLSVFDPWFKHIMCDRDGNVWFATWEEGLVVFDDHYIRSRPISEDIYLRDHGLASDGSMWMVNPKSALLFQYYPNSDSLLEYDLHEHLGSNVLAGPIAVFEETIWFAISNWQVGRLKEDSLSIFGASQGMNVSISDMVFDDNGILYLSGFWGMQSTDGNTFTDYFPDYGGHFRGLNIGLNGEVLCANDPLGYLKFYRDSVIILSPNELPVNELDAASNLKDDIFFLSTLTNGFVILQDSNWTRFNVHSGVMDNKIYDAYADEYDNVWIASARSLQSVSLNDLTTSDRASSSDVYFEPFGKEVGLEDNFDGELEFAHEGQMLYLVNGGRLISIDTEKHHHKKSPAKVLIKGVQLNGKVISTDIDGVKFTRTREVYHFPEDLVLASTNNHLTFHFSAVNYSEPDKLFYSFKLVGLEHGWSDPTQTNTADYRSLPHGKFTFQVRVRLASGDWSSPTMYSFEILPPWYRTWWAYLLLILLMLAIGYLILKWRLKQLALANIKLENEVKSRTEDLIAEKKEVEFQKERSEELLLNILPEEVAVELKSTGTSEAKHHGDVSVLFTDIKGFTEITEDMSPSELVDELNGYFKTFDEITNRFGIEKIKTIGDSYMCAAGLPVPVKTHAQDIVKAGLEMQAYIVQRARESENSNKPLFQMRIGIHTGPVVAGIVGIKKYAYDIWGDTVNTASRMESAGEVGKVNISQSTYELIMDDPQFTFEHRGKLEAKGKGELDMYFVSLA